MADIFLTTLKAFIAQHGRRQAATLLCVSPRQLASLRAGTLRPTAAVLGRLGLAEVTRPKTAPQAEQVGNSGGPVGLLNYQGPWPAEGQPLRYNPAELGSLEIRITADDTELMRRINEWNEQAEGLVRRGSVTLRGRFDQ